MRAAKRMILGLLLPAAVLIAPGLMRYWSGTAPKILSLGLSSAVVKTAEEHQEDLSEQNPFELLNYSDIDQSHKILQLGYDQAPIIIESHKLMFFTIPKNACTVWKKLFRRVMGYDDWIESNSQVPHNPSRNGLTDLSKYKDNLTHVHHLLTSPEWTRAIFLRDPKERLVSAFLDKAFAENGMDKCCNRKKSDEEKDQCVLYAQTLGGFMDTIQTCRDHHWMPQSIRMESEYWNVINFVGYHDTLSQDAKRLLERVGLWRDYGSSGWGRYGNESIFQTFNSTPPYHATGARMKVSRLIDSADLENRIEAYLASDYQLEQANFTTYRINL